MNHMKKMAAGLAIAFVCLGTAVSTAIAAAPAGSERLLGALNKHAPNLPIEDVYEAPLPGFIAVELAGGNVLYGSADGRYFYFGGDLYEMGAELVNLTEGRRATKRKRLLDAVPMEEMVVFSPAGTTRTHVSVFTDIDCGYCRKLHQEVAEINALGIEVRYLAYPRAGMGTPSAAKIITAWCADDRNDAMTALKAGEQVPMASCSNPVANQIELGRQVGVSGTPAIVTADGRLLPGYMPAQDLAEAIGLD